jgi:ATP adenylyltransferase
MTYITNADRQQDEGCVFCEETQHRDGPINLILHRGRLAYVILNRYPYTSGHLMIVPFVHCSLLEDLDPDTRAELMELASQAIAVLTAEYHPQGFNLGMNIGEIAGAGIAAHVHMHIVPRWGGDTSFMTTTGGTRVLPESLEDTYTRLHTRWIEFSKQ